MSRYDLAHERRGGRCAWCWEPLGETDSHTVVRACVAPALELRFHHECWLGYRTVSGIEGRELKALYREWSPQRVETLRMHAGLNMAQFTARLHMTRDRLSAYLSGKLRRLGRKVTTRLRNLAMDTRFERQEEAGAVIDWSDRRAVFCLCMHCDWKAGDLARRLEVRDTTVTAWWERGCPKESIRHCARLSVLARQHGFDAGMLLDDHLWTPELARRAVERSGLSRSAFAQVAGCGESLIGDAQRGLRRLTRQVCYYLTRGALQLGLPLPPVGRIGPKRRGPRPFAAGFGGRQPAQMWRPEELAVLGTVPDREAAERLRPRTYIAVLRMRQSLDIPRVPAVHWDGTPRPCPVPLGEVLRRYYGRIDMAPPVDDYTSPQSPADAPAAATLPTAPPPG
jgi:DNA-binding transcriptional regulator YiaG